VAQIGYIVLGASFASQAGLQAGIVHLFNHALAKGGLFLAVACLALHCRDLRIDSLGGVAARMPWTAAALLVCGFSLIGVPGTAGFISKWLLIVAALEIHAWGWLLVAVIVVSSLMAVVYIWRIVESLYFRAPVEGNTPPGEAPLPLLLMAWLVAALNVGFGLFPALPLELADRAALLLMRHTL
jgi:multicomponent Na+:H+ antiporter subunit D